MKVLEDFRKATEELIKAFAEKQELDFDFSVVNNPAEIANFNLEYLFNISDIYHDLATNQPKGLIKEWYWDRQEKDHNINYYSYTMGARVLILNK